MDERERFRQRNRIDATIQEYATGFVDMSDLKRLPTHVAYPALTPSNTGKVEIRPRYQADRISKGTGVKQSSPNTSVSAPTACRRRSIGSSRIGVAGPA